MPYDIGKTLKKFRSEAKMSVKQISEILVEHGFKATESTIYSWENNNSQPTPGALLTMCKAYGVSDVLSSFGYDGFAPDEVIEPTESELKIIEKYRFLDSHGKEMVDIVIDKEYDRCQSEEQEFIAIPMEELRNIPLTQRLQIEQYIDDEGVLRVARVPGSKRRKDGGQ